MRTNRTTFSERPFLSGSVPKPFRVQFELADGYRYAVCSGDASGSCSGVDVLHVPVCESCFIFGSCPYCRRELDPELVRKLHHLISCRMEYSSAIMTPSRKQIVNSVAFILLSSLPMSSSHFLFSRTCPNHRPWLQCWSCSDASGCTPCTG